MFGLVGVKPVTREGTHVLFRVEEDVRDNRGRVVIEEGAPATGTVTDSQVAGGFKPHQARLAITIDSVLAEDGTFVPLRFEEQHEGKWSYVFDRDETGRFANSLRSEYADVAFDDKKNKEAVKEFMSLFVNGEATRIASDPMRLLKLRSLAEKSRMPLLVRFIDAGKVLELAHILSDIQSGEFGLRSIGDLKKMASAFGVIHDAWRAGNSLTSWVGGRFKSPQIVVPVGFPLEAVVDEG